MSYNKGTITTEYIDPNIFVPNNRCTFELDGSKEGYLPNMRLLNIGVTSATGGRYNRLCGALSVVKSIRLMDGRTELSALRSPREYMAFQSQLRTNSDNKSSASWEKRNALGMEINSTTETLAHLYKNPTTTAVESGDGATPSAYLDLREVFPILNAIPVLPTAVFENLRIEIEFFNAATDQVLDEGALVPIAIRPVLAVDTVEDPRLLQPLVKALRDRGGRWNEIETDRFTMTERAAAQTAGTRQNVKQQSMGFIGKRVERLLMVKTLQNKVNTVDTTSNKVFGYGNVASQAFLNQHTQYRLNGKNVMPGFNGITKPNERLGIVSDAYGPSSAYPGSVYYHYANANQMVDWNAPTGVDATIDGKAFSGALSYDCVRIGARVADLAISISREFDADPGLTPITVAPASTNLAITVNLYAEIDKLITVAADGSYRIVYV